MRFRIKSEEDFWAGVMFAGFGLTGLLVARAYPMGTALRMGPGYFPICLSGLLLAMGAIIMIRSLQVSGERVSGFRWRGPLLLGLAFLSFGLLMDTFALGFAAAVASVVVFSALAERDFRPLQVAVLTLVLVGAAVGTFIYGLNLPYPVFWWR